MPQGRASLRQLAANRPLRKPADVHGLLRRVSGGEVPRAVSESRGATPVKMPICNVIDTLTSGMVTRQENTWANIFSRRFYTHKDGITGTDHGVTDLMLVTSTACSEKLAPSPRDDPTRTGGDATHAYNRFSFEINELAKVRMPANGGVVRRPMSAERAAWVGAFEPVWPRFKDQIGAELIQAVRRGSAG
ncbi:MAG: TRAP transporter substrate-binding protein DctP [Pikeienuella sp.]